MARVVTFIQPKKNKSGISSPETTEYESLLTNNKTIIGAINELHRKIEGESPIALCGTVLSGDVLCGEGVENNVLSETQDTYLEEDFIDKFGGR